MTSSSSSIIFGAAASSTNSSDIDGEAARIAFRLFKPICVPLVDIQTSIRLYTNPLFILCTHTYADASYYDNDIIDVSDDAPNGSIVMKKRKSWIKNALSVRAK